MTFIAASFLNEPLVASCRHLLLEIDAAAFLDDALLPEISACCLKSTLSEAERMEERMEPYLCAGGEIGVGQRQRSSTCVCRRWNRRRGAIEEEIGGILPPVLFIKAYDSRFVGEAIDREEKWKMIYLGDDLFRREAQVYHKNKLKLNKTDKKGNSEILHEFQFHFLLIKTDSGINSNFIFCQPNSIWNWIHFLDKFFFRFQFIFPSAIFYEPNGP
ncbi:hypothetical protein LXL04_028815 [Taraxacum kok-saghyz]